MMRKMQKGGDGASRITVFTKSNFEGDSKERTFINQRLSTCLSQFKSRSVSEYFENTNAVIDGMNRYSRR